MHLLHIWEANGGSTQYLYSSCSQTLGSSHGQLEHNFTRWKKTVIALGAKQYHLDIVGVSSTKCHSSDTVELNENWKLFYSGVDVTMSAQAEVGIFVSPCLVHSVTD